MGAPPMFQPQGVRNYAGWWRRVLAAIVDGIVSWLFLIPAVVVMLTGPTTIEFRDGSEGPGLYEVPTNGTIGWAFLVGAIGWLAFFVMYVRMLGKGASLGKKAAGYRVLDERTHEPIGTARAVGRYFATILSALPLYLGFLWPLWDDENRTFHDMIVGTRAIVD